MLRKIEERLLYLLEARRFIEAGSKRKDLDKRETELYQDRKDDKFKKKKAQEDEILQERQRKNELRIKKQHEMKIFKGRKVMARAKKPEVKPKETNDDKPS